MSENEGLEASSTVNSIDDSSEMREATIHVVGVGLSGAASLSPSVLALVESASLVIGAQRHLDAFEYLWMPSAEGASQKGTSQPASSRAQACSHAVEAWPLGNFSQVFADLRSRLTTHPHTRTVILASGDPLFFGLGRLLLSAFAAEQLVFHPQVSAIQLAFSRLKLPWQDATLVSVHGRGEALLIKALKRGDSKIAVLTDGVMTPGAIASLLQSLDLPMTYQLWVCENLGDERERLSLLDLSARHQPTFSPLNVVVLVRQGEDVDECPVSESLFAQPSPQPQTLPLIGLPDAVFKGFPDRPTLMTKREVRLLILGALAPLPGQTVWDIGAGTGSVSVELSRLCPTARLYAIEKTAMGAALIRHNAQQLAIAPIQVIQSKAMDAIATLPRPERIFIGGSSGQLEAILDFLQAQLEQHPVDSNQSPLGEMGPKVDENLTTSQATLSQSLSEPSQHPQHTQSIKPSNAHLYLPSCRIVLALATIEHLAQVTAWVRQPRTTAKWHYQLTQINVSRSLPVGPLTRLLPLNPVTLVTLDWQG